MSHWGPPPARARRPLSVVHSTGCKQCGAIYVVRPTWGDRCGALYGVQSMWCNLCGAICVLQMHFVSPCVCSLNTAAFKVLSFCLGEGVS